MRARDLNRFTADAVRSSRHRRRHLRARHRVRSRRAGGFARRSSRRETLAAQRRSTIRRRRTAACGRCRSARLDRAIASRSASGARSRASHRGCCVRCRSWSARIDPGPATASRCAQPSSSTRGSADAATIASSRSSTCRLPRLISKAATLRLFPGIKPDGLTGGAQWYDYQIVEADRLTFAFAEAADRSGVDLANYAEAIGRRARRRTHLRHGGSRRAHRRHVRGLRPARR